MGRFLLPLVSHHETSEFEVFAYSRVLAPDAITQSIRSQVDCWRNTAGMSDERVAEQIRKDRIDILVDLTMHAASNRLLVFARKPAPVQVTYLAYCSTTGLETVDYRLSDPYLDPAGGDESHYSEQTIRLPQTYWCYQPSVARRAVVPLPAQEGGSVTFGCLNNFCKVSDPVLTAWTRLLRALPDSKLLLYAKEGSHRDRVVDRFRADGVNPLRIEFTGKVQAEAYFAMYDRIDIALDTFPFGGGTTTCDALWMGVPVISLAGKTGVGRGGLSILSNIGLPELVARSEDQYVHLAAGLAHDHSRLGHLSSTLRERMERSPVMDAPGFARNIESAYRRMWREWCESNGR